MVQLICLANSRKRSGRCIAGIEPATGQWIRPISRLDSGQLPISATIVDGQSLQLLDIVDMPLADTGKGYESENRLTVAGRWKRKGGVNLAEIMPYCEPEILHWEPDDRRNAVPYSYLLSLPPSQRRTLQLIETHNFQVWQSDQGKWRGIIPVSDGSKIIANITDPVFCTKLDSGYAVNPHCLLIISLSQPWNKPESKDELQCYRLIAGVIELSQY